MKFLVDAQLPVVLKFWLLSKGFNTIHTMDLPDKNLTTDLQLIEQSVNEKRIVISKDGDFLKYFILQCKPYKLLMITTGNIPNKNLIEIFKSNWDKIAELLKKNKVVEIDNTTTTVHY